MSVAYFFGGHRPPLQKTSSLQPAHGCKNLELDSGVQRFDAHRFYLLKRMNISSYHFSIKITDDT